MPPLIIAHRGASHDAPENTLASFALGWEQDADAAELDIHLTADGQVVVLHDPTLDRVTGRKGEVRSFSMAAIADLDAGSWKNATFRDARIPTLAQVLAGLPAQKRLYIEIKTGPEILAPLQVVLASSTLAPDRTTIMSFDFAVCTGAVQILPGCSICWLQKYSPNRGTGSELADIVSTIARVRAVGLHGLSLHPDWPVTAEVARAIRDAGLVLNVWTVNDPRLARRLVSFGIDGLITDRPGWMRSQLRAT